MQDQISSIMILILGDERVGKRSIVSKYLNDEDAMYDPCLEDRSRTTITIDGSVQLLELPAFDFSRLEWFSLGIRVLQRYDGFIFVYDISSAKSFEGMKKLYNDIGKERNNRQIMLVGNRKTEGGPREVTTEAGRLLAQNWHCHFFETTTTPTLTQAHTTVDSIILTLALQIHQVRQEKLAIESRKTLKSRTLSMISTLNQTPRKVGSSFHRLWSSILCRFFRYERPSNFVHISGLDDFLTSPIKTVSSFSLPEMWSAGTNRDENEMMGRGSK